MFCTLRSITLRISSTAGLPLLWYVDFFGFIMVTLSSLACCGRAILITCALSGNTFTILVLYPRYVTTKCATGILVCIKKLPAVSEEAPVVVPSNEILAKGNGELVAESVIVPLTEVLVCP